MKYSLLLIWALIIGLLLSGCSSMTNPTILPTEAPTMPDRSERGHPEPTEPVAEGKPVVTAPPLVVPLPTGESQDFDMPGPPPGDPHTQALVAHARSLLAEYLNIGEDQIQFLDFELVTWPDGGLGCPRPGEVYIQIMIEGYRIQFSHAGQVYDFHGGSSTEPFLCLDGKTGAIINPSAEATIN